LVPNEVILRRPPTHKQSPRLRPLQRDETFPRPARRDTCNEPGEEIHPDREAFQRTQEKIRKQASEMPARGPITGLAGSIMEEYPLASVSDLLSQGKESTSTHHSASGASVTSSFEAARGSVPQGHHVPRANEKLALVPSHPSTAQAHGQTQSSEVVRRSAQFGYHVPRTNTEPASIPNRTSAAQIQGQSQSPLPERKETTSVVKAPTRKGTARRGSETTNAAHKDSPTLPKNFPLQLVIDKHA
jgi:hypothetical protein